MHLSLGLVKKQLDCVETEAEVQNGKLQDCWNHRDVQSLWTRLNPKLELLFFLQQK